jgi:predicted AlkP superfamily pyrophosphatase or phosphodiesterase
MKKLIVFSADAMVTEDLELLKTLPNYKKYLEGGCRIDRVRSVYPTITYPCHTTMITGVYPDKHGVSGNYMFMPGTSPLPWKWDRSNNLWKEDIFTAAKAAGYSTAAVFWPVTGNHPAIDCLIDEYWTQSPDDTPRDAFRRMGSNETMLDIMEKHIGDNRLMPKHPEIEHFIIDCACDIIRQYKPDIMFLHPANIDHYRHVSGLFGPMIDEGVRETDRWIGDIMSAVEDAGMLADTNFVLTSDHGQMDIKRAVNLNILLADAGLVTVNADGTLADWQAWCLSGGMSVLVHLKDPDNKEIYDKTYKLLCHLRDEGVYGVSRVLTAAEAEQHHLKGDFSFVLETDDYTAFADEYVRPLVHNFDSSDYRTGRATHGYLPEKGPQPVFLAKGPDFAENVVLGDGRLIDQAPTYAKLLGVELPHAQGRAIEEFFRK